MKKFIVFDTETTGLPKDYKASAKDVDNWPRIIQLAWVVFDENGQEIGGRSELIKPDGWVIPKQKFWIENGYSTEKNEAEGVEIEPLLRELVAELNDAELLIAHNMSFDSKVVGAEMYRKGIDTGKQVKKFCTKTTTTKWCAIPHQNGRGGYKWPKLIELHLKLFGTGFDDAHDALADVRACGRCFFELLKRGIISI
jgi:DNA polymerase-3 subunit epsilon